MLTLHTMFKFLVLFFLGFLLAPNNTTQGQAITFALSIKFMLVPFQTKN